jgi:hypothetical protein
VKRGNPADPMKLTLTQDRLLGRSKHGRGNTAARALLEGVGALFSCVLQERRGTLAPDSLKCSILWNFLC